MSNDTNDKTIYGFIKYDRGNKRLIIQNLGTFSARAKSSKFNKKLKIKEINSAPRSPKKKSKRKILKKK